MQTKDDLEKWYDIPDRWQYFISKDDEIRKEAILKTLPHNYVNALDIGCGECFVTKDLPAERIYGLELSDNAAARFPSNVIRVNEPDSKLYDLVISTGTLYTQYNHEQIDAWIRKGANYNVLIAGIKEWLLPYTYGEIIYQTQFKYLQYTQSITLYKIKP